jgi:hypothetical protein
MSDRVLFVHAGGPKTGTSFLQNFFESNLSQLESLGIAYENNIILKATYDITAGNGVLLFEKLHLPVSTEQEIDALVLSYFGECNVAICSSEFFSDLKSVGWGRLHASTIRLNIKLNVIFYVRNVLPFLISGYDQLIKRHGMWRSFGEWIVNVTEYQHYNSLQQMYNSTIPLNNIHVLSYDLEKKDLIKSFFQKIGIDAALLINLNRQSYLVNRSLVEEERQILLLINKSLGSAYSQELSDILISENPNIKAVQALFNFEDVVNELGRFDSQIDWINSTFFSGQRLVTIVPTETVKTNQSEVTDNTYDALVKTKVLEWAIKKISIVQIEISSITCEKLINVLKNRTRESHIELPDDFDALTYLLLNQDIMLSDIDPEKHFIEFGKKEGRAYKL